MRLFSGVRTGDASEPQIKETWRRICSRVEMPDFNRHFLGYGRENVPKADLVDILRDVAGKNVRKTNLVDIFRGVAC